MPRRPGIPKAHPHRGQARLRLQGEEYYLGPWGSPEARAEEARLVHEWLLRQAPDCLPRKTRLTVNVLVSRYLVFAKAHYSNQGKPTRQYTHRIPYAIRPLCALFGDTPADEFTPVRLKAVRQWMVAQGWVRRYVNHLIACLKRVWDWGVEEDLVPVEVFHRLQRVKGIRKGRLGARESPKVLPVSAALVRAVLPCVAAPVAAMIRLQFYAGMRPGEVVQLRPQDLEQRSAVWVYRPGSPKLEHLEGDLPQEDRPGRQILLGPRCRRVLRPFLDRPPDCYCFSPREAGNVKVTCANDHYRPDTYLRAVHYGCAQAFPLPAPLARQVRTVRGRKRRETNAQWEARLGPARWAFVRAWHAQHYWHPNRLRHAAATRIRRQYGLEMARVILGHSNPLTTLIYAEADLKKAARAMRALG